MLRDNVTPTGASAGVDVGKANGNGGIDRHSPRQWNKSVMKGRRRRRANSGGAVASRCRMIVVASSVFGPTWLPRSRLNSQ